MKPLVFSFAGLLVVIAITYGTLRYLRSEKNKVLADIDKEKNKTQTESVQLDSPKTKNPIVKEVKHENKKPISEADSLKRILDKYKQELSGRDFILDSLENVVKEKNKITQKRKKENLKTGEQDEVAEKAKAMAKTFEKMSIKQIAPILQNLDDSTVFLIYKETGNRFKKNILLAVSEKRAAQITKEYIHQN